MNRPLPDIEYLKTVFEYRDGCLYYKQTLNHRAKEGDMAGYDGGRYKMVSLKGISYLTHRVIYGIMSGHDPGDMMVDHIDGNTYNNLYENLQLVTNQQNQHKSRVCNGDPLTSNGQWTQRGLEYNRNRARNYRT